MLAIGNKTDRKPLIYFVGLSAKPMCEHLAPETRTGNIIEQIIHHLPSVKTIKTNLVKTPPIDQEGKLRYPNPNEMKIGWDELQNEMNQTFPNLLVTLGQQVSFFLRSQMGVQPAKPQLPADFSYESYLSQSKSNILSIHHPSFVFVYRRKDIENYVENVVLSILSLILERDN
jgi:DNA polymerase